MAVMLTAVLIVKVRVWEYAKEAARNHVQITVKDPAE